MMKWMINKDNKMKNKKGFTVAELMIALGLMGVLVALAIPATVGNLPNKNLLKFHRALNSFQTAIQAVLMDASETQEFTDKLDINITKGDDDDTPCYQQRTCTVFNDDGVTCKTMSALTNEITPGNTCYDANGNIRKRVNASYTEGMQYPLVKKGTLNSDNSGTVVTDTITVQMLCNYIAGKMNVKQNNCGGGGDLGIHFITSDNVSFSFGDWDDTDEPTSLTVTVNVDPDETPEDPSNCNTKIQYAANNFTLTLTPQGKITSNCAAATKMITE